MRKIRKEKKEIKKTFNRVAIIGLGVMGASLGMALKKGKIAKNVVGFARRLETRKKALACKIVDIACDRIESAVHGADFIVFCAPVSVIPGMIKSVAGGFLAPGAVLTDVGSVKNKIVVETEKILYGCKSEFIGSHPIAGSEQHGLEAARADLYRGAVVALTPTPCISGRALQIAREFWRALGAEVVVVGPEEHDRIIARTSHLPHIIAALLAGCVGRDHSAEYGKFCGGGFRDTTRIAEGDPELWHDILENNTLYLKKELEAYQKELKKILGGLKKDKSKIIKKYLKLGVEGRHSLLSNQNTGRASRFYSKG